ncbi:MAG: helix-turn-helix domain-containing protein [Clostridia bacterium]
MTFKAISQLVQKDPTTISYEIKHHRQEHRNSFTYDHEPCPLLLKAPFVCNGCSKRHCSSCHSHTSFTAPPWPIQNTGHSSRMPGRASLLIKRISTRPTASSPMPSAGTAPLSYHGQFP